MEPTNWAPEHSDALREHLAKGMSFSEIAKAINYLVLGRSYGGRYILRKPSGYPNFRGVMTFSINWDRFANFGFSRGIRPVLNGLP